MPSSASAVFVAPAADEGIRAPRFHERPPTTLQMHGRVERFPQNHFTRIEHLNRVLVRSADLQSAVSRISNLQVLGPSGVWPTGSRRYGRLETCATRVRFMGRLSDCASTIPNSDQLREHGPRGAAE